MKYEFKPSFDKSIKSLPLDDKIRIKGLCSDLIDILEGSREFAQGLGLKNLRGNFWEIRKGLRLRIVFRWEKDYIEFILAGNHDQIKKFLKKVQ